MNTADMVSNDPSKKQKTRIFRNHFGHFRAGWRILFYIVVVVLLFKLFDFLGNSFLLIRGENLSDYELIVNRFVSKFYSMLSVFIPGFVLLKWADKRPVSLLGMGSYRGSLRELAIGMFMGFILINVTVSILWLTGWAAYSFSGLPIDMLFYLLCYLVVLVISAFYEEILFRGYIFQSLIEGSNFWITLGIFSLLFGAAHIGNAEATVYTVLVTVVAGIFLGIIYFRTRALWMCIGLHFMWNWTMGPVFGMGINNSKFIKRSLFNYNPSESSFIHGADAMSEIVLGLLVVALTIYLWRAKWLKPAEYNRALWAKYPHKYGTEPELSE